MHIQIDNTFPFVNSHFPRLIPYIRRSHYLHNIKHSYHKVHPIKWDILIPNTGQKVTEALRAQISLLNESIKAFI
nr:hypothetical protein Iba_chr15aCG0280 [Ipomoea batatas]GMD96086.1 hypothetical protein Iba_chr15bCG1380 [Ipomoea batatas]